MPIHHFKLGNLNLTSLQDNAQTIDIRQELGQVPEGELLAAMQSHGYKDFNTQIGFNILFVQTPDHKVLIDCGTGMNDLLDSMSEAKLKADEIDYLIITHSDFDHIGGIDHFPNAKIFFPKPAYDLWTNDMIRKGMIENFKTVFLKFLDADFVARGAAYREDYGANKLPGLNKRIQLIKEEEEFLPGFKMVFTPGHRPDHFAVEIESEGETLVHIADGYRHAIQVDHPDWYSHFDSYPEQMAESLVMINDRIKSKGALVFGSHFTFPGLARFDGDRLVMGDGWDTDLTD